MFFSTEFLARRDSGYGLLWLAATLGSKSKKLARREVVSADITRLCTLVSQPPEPLALRLSSNLMVGVVRVYKLKHDIFENDVNSCVLSLKKNLNELRMTERGGIEMIQVAHRSGALNMQIDPAMYLAIELDGIIDDWDAICRNINKGEQLSDDSSLSSLNPERSVNASYDKKELHKLDESFEHLFSNSFLKSFRGETFDNLPTSPGNVNDSVFFNLDFDEPIGLGEEMEKDLEEAWRLPLRDKGVPSKGCVIGTQQSSIPAMPVDALEPLNDILDAEPADAIQTNEGLFDERIFPMRAVLEKETERVCVDVDLEPQQVETIIKKPFQIKTKRWNGIFLDPTTELSDEQMKANRQNYSGDMERQRMEIKKKRIEKERKRKFEEALWNPPPYFHAPELICLWNERVLDPVRQQASWKGSLENNVNGRPKKRHQTGADMDEMAAKLQEHSVFVVDGPGDIVPFNGDHGIRMKFDTPLLLEFPFSSGSRRSSQDLGQPRHASNPPLSHSSILEHGVHHESQGGFLSNNIFPWDNAPTSSSTGVVIDGLANKSDAQFSIEGPAVRLRRGLGSIGSSPTVVFSYLPLPDLNSEGEVVLGDNEEEMTKETPGESDHAVILERNSFNFLGYVKMHSTTTPGELLFSDIVPIESSSARVAAEGFYHCLALATKRFMNLNQIEPYGLIRIQIL